VQLIYLHSKSQIRRKLENMSEKLREYISIVKTALKNMQSAKSNPWLAIAQPGRVISSKLHRYTDAGSSVNWGAYQGLEPTLKEPVLEPESLKYWEPKPLF